MANKETVASPTPQGSENQTGKKNGVLFGLIAFLVATLIMILVIGGAFYYVVSKNINGIADKYRKEISGIPIINWALPKLKDPYDPKYLTEEQLKTKYNELRKLREDLTQQLTDANKKIEELNKVKDEKDKVAAENTKLKADAEAQKAQLDAEKKQLETDKKAVADMIAKGDKTGFKAYFEKVDPATAAKVYADIVKDQKVSEGAKKNAKLYDTMDPAATAKIFTQLGNAKIDLVADTLKNMNQDIAAQVMAAMDTNFAAKVAEKLQKVYTTP